MNIIATRTIYSQTSNAQATIWIHRFNNGNIAVNLLTLLNDGEIWLDIALEESQRNLMENIDRILDCITKLYVHSGCAYNDALLNVEDPDKHDALEWTLENINMISCSERDDRCIKGVLDSRGQLHLPPLSDGLFV